MATFLWTLNRTPLLGHSDSPRNNVLGRYNSIRGGRPEPRVVVLPQILEICHRFCPLACLSAGTYLLRYFPDPLPCVLMDNIIRVTHVPTLGANELQPRRNCHDNSSRERHVRLDVHWARRCCTPETGVECHYHLSNPGVVHLFRSHETDEGTGPMTPTAEGWTSGRYDRATD